MSIQVSVDGNNYNVPENAERGWGTEVTNLLVALADVSLLIKGGSIPLTSEADFGPNFGLKSIYFKTRSSDPAAAGVLRLANTDTINWRNGANDADIVLGISSDLPTWDGVSLITEDSVSTLTNKTIDASLNTLSNIDTTMLASGVLITDTDLTGAADTNIPSTLAIKTYVDNAIDGNNEASEIGYTPTTPGDWTDPDPTNVQEGLDSLAGDRALKATTVTGTGAITGGGDLSTDRTLDVVTSGIDATRLASDAVETAKILDSNVTGAKLEDNITLPGTGSATIPAGTTAQRVATAEGSIRRNTETSKWEGYNGTSWEDLLTEGAIPAEDVSYDNSTSGLAATDVQAAIDEVDGDLDTHIAASSAHGVTGDIIGDGDNPVFTSTGSIKLPAGTEAQRPSGAAGDIRFNTESSSFEGYNGTDWGDIGGSGAGLANYITNPDFESSISTGVTTGGATPPSTSANDSTPLFGTQSLRITSGAGLGHVDMSLETIDEAITDGGILLGVTGYFSELSSGSEGDYKVGIYNTTDSEYVGGTEADIKPDMLNVHRTTFVPVAGKTYVYRVEHTVATGSQILDVDNLQITYQSSTAIQAFEQRTVWVDDSVVSVSNNNGGNVSKADFRVSRDANGQYLLEYRVEMTGASSDTSQTMTLGLGGATFDGTMAGTQGTASEGGRVFTNNGAATVTQNLDVSVTSINISGSALLSGKPSWFDDHIDDQKINLITPELLESNAIGKWSLTNTSYSANTVMDFDTPYSGFNNVGNWSNSNGTIIVPSAGKYEVTVSVRAVSDWAGGARLVVLVNSIPRSYIAAGTGNMNLLQGSTIVEAQDGDTITIESDNSRTLNDSLTDTFLIIARRPTYSSTAPVGFGTATTETYGLVQKGTAVADTTDVTDVANQLNALLASLRAAGVISN